MAKHSIPKRLIPWYGYRLDRRDTRDRIFAVDPSASVPPMVDLREHCPAPMDQGEIGSCTAHGITAALRYNLLKSGKPDVPLARLQIYYDERTVEGTTAIDAGAEIRDGIRSAGTLGVAHETLWPYDITKFKRKPPASVYKDALKFKALVYERVPVTAQALKSALAAGFPVVVGANIFTQFESDQAAKTGIITMPGTNEQSLGGHCFYLVGYGQHSGCFTARNSWGSDWADKGDFYLPEAYLDAGGQGSDYWIIRSLA